ncbi:hypothetical protein BESB_018460 [Besnoitia besnoiti]|uniref:BSD domain-containing protein n=1 Tax=Besnoitia besnoiti TaxID=94643 RepID=A0A2A9M204_BESBE|nr:hypothetical protein BESB_018460 [Besnoitia besnoiti]PFH32528.1 hypothetical protein BESB_018460 [Besnoitia besnoiti]
MEWQSPDKEGHRRAELGLEAAGNARSAGGTRATGVAPRRAGSQRRRGATPRDVAAVTDSGRVPEPSKNSFEEPIFCRQGNSVEEGDLVSSIIGTEQGEQPQMWAPELSSDATEQNSSNDEDVEEGTKSDGSGGANSGQLDSTRAPHSSALCARSPVPRSSVSVAPFRATSGSQDSLSSCQITVEGKPLVKPRVQPRQKVRPSHRLENETDLEEKETTRQVGNRGNSLFGGFLRSLSRKYAEAIHLLDGLDDDSNSNTSLSRHASATNSRGPLAELSSRASSARNQAPGAAPEIGRSRPRPWRRAPGEGRQSPTGDSERASKNKKSGVFPTTLRSLFSFSSSSWKKPPPGERGEANVERPPPSTSSPELVSGGSESSGVLRRHANRGARTAQRRSFLGSVAAAASGAFAEAGAVAAAAAAAVAAVGESSTDDSSDSSVVGAGQHGREQEQEKSTRKKEGDLENRVSRKRLMWKAAHRIREVDSRLSRLHFDIVPRRLKEEDFWKLYFYQVSLVMARYERQAHPLLRSLATSVVLASREERDEAQQQQPNVPDARECVSSSTESDTSSVSSSPHWGVSSPPASARLFIPPTGIQLTGDSDPEGRNGDSLPASHRGEPVGQAPPEGIGALAYAMFSSSRCPSLASSSPGHSGRPGGLTSSSGTTSVSAPGTASSVSPETGISPSVFPSDWKRPVAGSEMHAVGLDMPLARGPTSAVSLPSPANAGSPESAQQSCLCFTDPSTRPSLSASPSNSRSWKGTIYKNDECLSSTANGGRPTNCADEDEDARRRSPWGIQKETRPAQEVASDSVQRIGVFSKSPLPASTKESREKEGVCGERYQCGFACNGEEVQEARA